MADPTGISRRELLARGALLGGGALVAGPLLASCGSSAGGGGKNSLEIGVLYQAGAPYYKAYQRVGDEIKANHKGAKVTYTFANTAARPKLQLRWKKGDPPTLDYVFNSADRTSLHYVTDDELLDLSSQLSATQWGDGKTWSDAILPAFRHFAQYQDKYYMAPDEAVVLGLFYNGKLFDQWGLKPPTTWDELIDLAHTIRGKKVSPFAVTGTFQPYLGMWWDHLLLREVGAPAIMDVAWNGKKLADQPSALAAAQKLEALVNAKGFLDGFSGIDFTAAQAAFFQGQAAMILMGSWLQGEMKSSIPADFDLRVAPFPTVDGGSGDQQGLFGTMLGMSVAKKAKGADLGVEYLKLSAAKAEQTQRVKDLGIVSPYEGVPTPAGVAGLDDLLHRATTGTVTYYYYGISQDPQRTTAWYGPVANLFLGKTSAAELIKNIDSNLAGIRG